MAHPVADFAWESQPQRAQYGTGILASALDSELELLAAHRVLLVASSRAEADAHHQLAPVARISDVQRHVPAPLAATAVARAGECRVDVVVSIGGGSATGLSKAIALQTGLPLVAVPTTFSGSEMTSVWGITRDGVKGTGTDPRVLPRAVIYDAALLEQLPHSQAVASAINALAHGVDALWAPRATPLSDAEAEAGVRWIAQGLRELGPPPAPELAPGVLDPQAVRALVLGTVLTSRSFATAGSGLHHKICHVLGGAYDLPHAPLHSAVLPHVLNFNAPAAPAAVAALRRALDVEDPTAGLAQLYALTGAPTSLSDLGMRRDDLEQAAAQCLQVVPASNPRPVTTEDLRALLTAAWSAQPPSMRRAR